MKIYFDNAATTAVCEEVIEAMNKTMREDYGNPSSSHELGRRAKALLEEARGSIASALGGKSGNVIFASGGTEANNLAIFGVTQNRSLQKRGKHIITSATEHSSVLSPIKKLAGEGWDVTYLAPGSNGCIPAAAFAEALRDDTVFASVMLVNNETGAVNPVGEYTAEIRRRGLQVVFHTDAVQGFCKIPFTVKSLGAGLVTVSAHKLHGPKGIGALYVGDEIKLNPLMLGGDQEKGIRHGTEALPAISGFGESVRIAAAELSAAKQAAQGLREHTVGLLKSQMPQAVIISSDSCADNQASPYILCLSLPGYKSEVLMSYLDGEGICVSKGAACKRGSRSHVLEAMGLPYKVIDGALRVSFSRYNTIIETERFVEALKEAAGTLVHYHNGNY